MDLVTLAVAKKYTDDAIVKAATGDIDIEKHVSEEIAKVVDSAPDTLNTLNELAVALGDDPNFATTIATQIGNKVDKVSGKGLSTNDFTNAYKNKVDSALQSFTETDPTVPAWAKAATKPTYTASDVGAVPTTRTVNNKALSANISLTASDVNAVPTTRTVNGKALSGNITLSATDVKALPDTTTLFSGNYNDLSNKPTIPSIAGLATEEYVNNAVTNIVLTSEGGKKFKLTVSDDGTLTATEVTE
jgi:hypothetical protein